MEKKGRVNISVSEQNKDKLKFGQDQPGGFSKYVFNLIEQDMIKNEKKIKEENEIVETLREIRNDIKKMLKGTE